MLEKKVVNVPTNKTYTSPEDIAALGKFLRKVKEKQEEVVTLQEDNLALPERDVRDGNIENLKDHQQLVKTKVIDIDDLNKQIIDLSLSEKIELEKGVSPLEEKELIDKLPDESEKISPSETSLKEDKSLLNVEESLSLGDKREELLIKEKISLSDKSEKIENNQEVELDDESEKLRAPEDPQLDNSKEELKEGEEVKLSDKISKLSESQEIELETEKSQIIDNKEVSLEDEKSLLGGDKEVPLEDEKSQITDDRDIQLDNDSSKISDPSQVSLDEDRFNIKSPNEVPLENESSPLTPPASENEITSYLKNYTGYSAGMKYLMNLSGENIQLTQEEKKSLEEIKKYVGLASGDDQTAAKYQVTVDSLKKMGTWGEKFAAYLTAILNRNKNFRSIIPYSDIDLLYSAITSWEDKETGFKFKYGTAEDNQEGSGAKVVEPTDLYKYPRDLKNEEKVGNLREDLKKIIDNKQVKELWDESSHEAFSVGKGESLRIPESKIPEFSWKSGIKIGTILRHTVEETIGKLHKPELTGVTRQELIDATLSSLIIARRALEKITKTEKYRLPGTGNSYVNETKSIIENGVNEKSAIKAYQILFKKENNQLNVPVVEEGRVFDPRDKDKNTVWEKGYSYAGNYNIDLDKKIYSGLKVTLQDLTDINQFDDKVLSNYNDFLQAIKTSKIISTANLFTATEGSPKIMTLDSNHVWEVTLEPYLGPENGNISFLPAYREINQINEYTHGFKTSWGRWIPFTSYELNIKKLVSKTVPLYDGEITYPTGMEFTNELRLTIADDQYKSWKIYFEEVMKCMAYLSRPHSRNNAFQWEFEEEEFFIEREDEKIFTSDKYNSQPKCQLDCDAKALELKNSGYKIKRKEIIDDKRTVGTKTENSVVYYDYDQCEEERKKAVNKLEADDYRVLSSLTYPAVVSSEATRTAIINSFDLIGNLDANMNIHNERQEALETSTGNGFAYTIEYTAKSNNISYRYIINYSDTELETSNRRVDNPNYYDDSNINSSAFLEGVINPAPYKNVTFRCRIYSMTPQFSTIQKYDLLVILKDLQEEFQGEIDSGPTDLSLAFSIVGENPIGESFYNKTVDDKKPTATTKKTVSADNSGKSFLKKVIGSAQKIIS